MRLPVSHLFVLLASVLLALPTAAQQPDLQPLETYRFVVSVPVTECAFGPDTPATVLGAASGVAPPGAGSPEAAAAAAAAAAEATALGAAASGATVLTSRPRTLPAPPGSRVYYLSDVPGTDFVRVRFLEWAESPRTGSKSAQANARAALNRALFNERPSDPVAAGSVTVAPTFCMPRSSLTRYSQRVYATGRPSLHAVTGVLLLPIKARLGGSDRAFNFSADFSLGTTAGARMRLHSRREVFGSVLLGVGLASVRLDSLTTNGEVRMGVDRPALTLTGGLMLDVDRFQVGIFVGQDRIAPPNHDDWVHQGRPWVGVGMGYTLLSSPRATAPATTN